MDKRKTIALACLVFIGGYFAGNTNGKQQKVDEILTTMSEVQLDWYHWQDMADIVESKSIHGDVIVIGE